MKHLTMLMSQRITTNIEAQTSFTSFHISNMLFKSQNNMLFKTQLSYAPQVQYFNSPKVIYVTSLGNIT